MLVFLAYARRMIGSEVAVPVGGLQMPAYLARPQEGTGPHAAVIVLQEIFGLTPEVRRITDLIASAGHAGLAINYYHRTHPQMNEPYTEAGVEHAMEAAARITKDSLRSDVAAAAEWLNAQPFVRRGAIATWGTGFGGTAAFVTASLSELRGAISFYPWHVAAALPSGEAPPLDDTAKIAVPLLLCFGADDYYVSRYDIDRIRESLTAAHKDFRVEVYPGVGHAFFRHGRPEAVVEQRRYSDEAVAQAAADAWDLVQAFLAEIFTAAMAAG